MNTTKLLGVPVGFNSSLGCREKLPTARFSKMIGRASHRLDKVRFRCIQSCEDDLLKVCAESYEGVAGVARGVGEPLAWYQLFEAVLAERPYEIVMPNVTAASRVIRAAERMASDD